MFKGALIGDLYGGDYEPNGLPLLDPLPTPQGELSDDSILTFATAAALLADPRSPRFEKMYRAFFKSYPNRGYGGGFTRWASLEVAATNHSWANGGAMRVSPIAFAVNSLEEAVKLATRSCDFTHDHPFARIGAQLQCGAVYLWHHGATAEEVISFCNTVDNGFTDSLPTGPLPFDCRARESVRLATAVALQAQNSIEGLRLALSLGGDCDTITSMAMVQCCARFGTPQTVWEQTKPKVPTELLSLLDEFNHTYTS